jgi:hypothetical protein
MKKFRFFFLTMVVLLVMCLSFTACDSGGSSDPTYTVLISRFNWYSNMVDYGGLRDGYWLTVEVTNSQYNTLKVDYKNGEQRLTVDQIASQLVSWGFGPNKAKEAANELISRTPHGELGYRVGSTLYCILK